MTGPMSLRFSTQAMVDVRRITSQLAQIQGQIASGAKANDLQGFGGASSRLLSAQSLKASADARSSVISQLQARFGVQGAALGQVAESASGLAIAIREAISANDGRGVGTELELSFASITSALNETWNGQPLFGGERQGAGPIKITSLDQLQDAAGPEDIFDEAARHQIIDMGTGAPPIKIAAKASELSQGLFDVLKDLKDMVDANGGSIGQPISTADRAALMNFAEALETQASNFTNEEGRSGQLQSRFEDEQVRLQQRSDLLTKEIGAQADADPAELSIQLNALLVQYQAAAKTFSELSKLTLLDYL